MLQLLLLLRTQQHRRSLHRYHGFHLMMVRGCMRKWLLRLFNVETALLTLVCPCLLLLLLDELELLLLGRVDVHCGKSIY